MSKKLMMPAILSLTMLAACQTTPSTGDSPAPQTADAPVQAVPCPSDPPISYHAPKVKADAEKWQAGQLSDPTNHYDTPDTVSAVRKHNAAVVAVCGSH